MVQFPPPDKERPVLVLTRSSMIDRLSRITVAPVTSTIRDVPSEVMLGAADGLKRPCAVNLYNVTTVHRRVLGRRVALLDAARMRDVCAAMAFALGCDA